MHLISPKGKPLRTNQVTKCALPSHMEVCTNFSWQTRINSLHACRGNLKFKEGSLDHLSIPKPRNWLLGDRKQINSHTLVGVDPIIDSQLTEATWFPYIYWCRPRILLFYTLFFHERLFIIQALLRFSYLLSLFSFLSNQIQSSLNSLIQHSK